MTFWFLAFRIPGTTTFSTSHSSQDRLTDAVLSDPEATALTKHELNRLPSPRGRPGET